LNLDAKRRIKKAKELLERVQHRFTRMIEGFFLYHVERDS